MTIGIHIVQVNVGVNVGVRIGWGWKKIWISSGPDPNKANFLGWSKSPDGANTTGGGDDGAVTALFATCKIFEVCTSSVDFGRRDPEARRLPLKLTLENTDQAMLRARRWPGNRENRCYRPMRNLKFWATSPSLVFSPAPARSPGFKWPLVGGSIPPPA